MIYCASDAVITNIIYLGTDDFSVKLSLSDYDKSSTEQDIFYKKDYIILIFNAGKIEGLEVVYYEKDGSRIDVKLSGKEFVNYLIDKFNKSESIKLSFSIKHDNNINIDKSEYNIVYFQINTTKNTKFMGE